MIIFMKNPEYYIKFCSKFNNSHLPKLKLKSLNDRYSYLYKEIFKINENNINRASFIIFIISFFTIVSISLFFFQLNILIISLYSVIISFIITYRFNLVLYYEIVKMEKEINAILHLIKINFSLIQKTMKNNSDSCLNFINLIKEYRMPIKGNFNTILKRIHEGSTPETELLNIISPSKDFNQYIRFLLMNNFEYRPEIDDFQDNTLENNFRIYLREIQSKISIIFFIGIFFPVGLCFLILFQILELIIIIILIPFFLYFLNLLCRKFVRKHSYLIGILKEYSNSENKIFNEFLLLLNSFAINLNKNISPELAFLKSYVQNKNLFVVFKPIIRKQISNLLNFKLSLREMIQFLKLELKSIRYHVILDAIDKFITENANYSSDKIFEILNVVHKHQKLEKKLEIIIKGEKFKIFFFIFLLPLLIGAISGMLPLFLLITRSSSSLSPIISINHGRLINAFNIFIIFLIFLSSISITTVNFLKIINFQKNFPIILISNLIFILTFLISFLNIANFI